ncbi:MAG: hypothetical protein WD749_10285 [Phycisphaerales bacterium]
MAWDQIQQRWDEYKRRVRERWGRLAEHEVDEFDGERDRLVGKVAEVYGIERSEAEGQVREFEESVRPGRDAP